MFAATAGSGILGLWDEAAALVFLYGVTEGTRDALFVHIQPDIRVTFVHGLPPRCGSV